MRNITVSLPLKPVSINQAFRSIPRGRICTSIKSAQYRQFEEDALKLLPRKEMIKGEVEMTIEFHLKHRYTVTDTNNLSKCIIDIIQKAGYIENDNKIAAEHYYKYRSDDWNIKIIITEFNLTNTMKYIDKISEEFDEKFPNLGASDPDVGWYNARIEVKSFLSEKIQQAIAEDRERIRAEIESKQARSIKVHFNKESVFYRLACKDLLDSLDKPLKDN